MFEAAAVGSLLAGGPIVAILGMIYNVIILGPTGFLGYSIFSPKPDSLDKEMSQMPEKAAKCTGPCLGRAQLGSVTVQRYQRRMAAAAT